MIKAAIFGASGYTGYELLRMLAVHPKVKVVEATSRQYKDKEISEVFPSLRGFYRGLKFSDPADVASVKADVAFSAMPHGASQEVVPALLAAGNRVIDLSADFRLHDIAVYKEWYGDHVSANLLGEAVYGLPELHREKIKSARLIANPGCYPTSAILALAPALRNGLIEPDSIIIDSKSGVSGAGRSASLDTSYVEVASGFKAYKIGCHRHAPEIEQELSGVFGANIGVTFTPHLLPTPRGILTTAYAKLARDIDTAELQGIYNSFYKAEPFVRVLPVGKAPDISQVRCSNFCDIGAFVDKRRGRAVIVSAIDNLVKGASGQAIQNMNILFGFDETEGLRAPPVGV